MKALLVSFISYLLAVGIGVFVGPITGWHMLSLKRRWPTIIGGSVCVFVVLPIFGVSGPLQAFTVVAWLTAIAVCIVLALIGRHLDRFRKLLDVLAARAKSR